MAISKSEPRITAAPALPVPKKIGRYEVIDRLATGGMAEVFVCYDRQMAGLERLVVVKRILPHLAVHAQFVEMFNAEARYVARLSHPNVVQIYELGEHEAAPYLAMEYVAGSSVRDVLIAAIEKGVATPIGAGIGLVAQACAGAHAAHELVDAQGKALGLVHRDISPHNLMVTADGHVKLLDFGIAKATETATFEDHTKTGALKGKVHYMAPEQCKQEPLDRRADVFALGIVAWELFAQERLFKRDSDLDSMQAIVTGNKKDIAKIRREMPKSVVDVLDKALATRREDRYATADDMRRAFLDAGAKAGLRCDADSVSSFVKPLLGDVHARRAAELIALAQDKTQATPAAGLSTEDATVTEARKRILETVDDRAPVSEVRPRSKSRSGVKIDVQTPEVSSATSLQRPKSKKRKFGVGRAAALGVVVVALLAAALFAFQKVSWMRQTPLKMVFPPVADRELIAADVAPFQKYLEDVLHRPVEISVATSYEDLLETVVASKADIGVLPPNTYVHAKLRDPRIEILASKLIDGSSGSDGEIFVPQTSTAHVLADLKGKRVCFSDPLSTTGYLLPRKAFRDAGLDPDKDIISHISGTHTQVLRDLVNDVCDAGATYSGGYLAADRAGVPVAQVRHFLFTGRTPQDAICATSTLSPSDRKKVQNALFAFDAKKAGTIGGHVERITGFSRSTDHDYDSVREVQP